MKWKPIKTAPKDRSILLYGEQWGRSQMVRYDGNIIFSGYWSSLDEAWCATGSHWNGPFFKPTHWMTLPDIPRKRRG